jgi:CHAD domain-containing protein
MLNPKTPVARDALFTPFAHQRLRELGRRFERALAALATGRPDPEIIHRLRVAARRYRASLKLARRGWTTEHERLAGQLAQLSTKLSTPRDLEVAKNTLRRTRPGHLFEKRWKRACGAWRRRLRSGELARWRAQIQRVRQAPLSLPEESVRQVERRLLNKVFRRVRKVWKSRPELPRDRFLHGLRRAVRRLRYTGEFFEPAGAKKVARLVRQAQKWQQLLGRHQDAVIVVRLLRHAPMGFDEILRETRQRKQDTARQFLRRWHRRGFRKLKRLIQSI